MTEHQLRVVQDSDSGRILTQPATPADLLAAVRAGVESGTIKGMVEKRHNGMHVPSEHAPDACSVHCVFADYLVVGPVSDGGSET